MPSLGSQTTSATFSVALERIYRGIPAVLDPKSPFLPLFCRSVAFSHGSNFSGFCDSCPLHESMALSKPIEELPFVAYPLRGTELLF